MLSASRDGDAAYRFLRKILNDRDKPRIINVDKNPAYPKAFERLRAENSVTQSTDLRTIKYLNNILEQDHRSVKKIIRPMLNFKSFKTALAFNYWHRDY